MPAAIKERDDLTPEVDTQTVTQCTKPVDVVFLLDGSGSIKKEPFKLMLDFAANVAGAFKVGTGPGDSRVGVASFAQGTRTEFKIGTHSSVKSLQSAMRAIP